MMRATRSPRRAATDPAAPTATDPGAAFWMIFQDVSQPGPLARTPFGVADELSCYYDAPAEPCTVHIEIRVPGRLDRSRLARAVGAALAGQPRAMVRRAAGGWWRRGYSWEVPGQPDADPLSAATWSDEAELGRLRARFLSVTPPLDSSPPLRVLLASGPGEDRVILNAHHAALDGLSCLELLRSIAGHYADAPEPAPPAAPAPEAPAPEAPAPETPSAITRLPAALAPPDVSGADPARSVGLSVLPKPAARVATDRRDDPERARAGYGFALLPGQSVADIRQAARQLGVTVNDLLIAALIAAIGRWNAEHGRPAGRIRITMPVNARRDDQDGATGNLSRLTTVTAMAPAGGPDLGGLVASVAEQTRAAKDHIGPQVDPVSRALATPWCPVAVKRGLLRLALRTAGPLVCDTSLVSNLGIVADPPRFAGLPATDMWFSTSAHMPRGLSVGVVTVGGKLHLCFRYRRALFSDAAAVRFAHAYTAALGDITNSGRQS
jgi:NRPS condensation-like uncharacterized protein